MADLGDLGPGAADAGSDRGDRGGDRGGDRRPLAWAPAPLLIETSVLPCGIRLVTETMADVHSVAVAYWVGTGSRDEPGDLAGASHFLEHLLFKGTERRSAAAIAEELDEVGGDCNAFTTKEYTTFYVRLLSEHLPLGLDILSDIMWEPALRPDDIEAERTVILDEILMHADEPADLAAERWQAALFPEHALGRDTLGTAASVQRITREDIRSFFEEHYRPANMVVSVAGDCTHDAVAADLDRRFAGTSGGVAPPAPRPGLTEVSLDVVRRSDRAGAPRLRHALGLTLRRAALGAGRLQPRPRRRPVEPAFPKGPGAARPRVLGVVGTGGLPGQRVAGRSGRHGTRAPGRGAAHRSAELELSGADGITERELAVAKGNLRAEMLLSGEDSGARMSRIGASLLLHGEVLSVDEVLARSSRRRAEVSKRRPSWCARRDPERRGSLRRARLRVPPARDGRPVACRPCSKVGVVGAGGRMGQEVCRAVAEAADMELVAAVDPGHVGADASGRTSSVRSTRSPTSGPTWSSTSPSPRRCATTCRTTPRGHPRRDRDERAVRRPTWPTWSRSSRASDANASWWPNFAIGAVLLMHLLPDRRAAHGGRRDH